MTMLSIGMTVPLYSVSSTLSALVIDTKSKLAIKKAFLELFPMYKPRAQASWFQVLFEKYKLVPSSRQLSLSHREPASSSSSSSFRTETATIDVVATLTIKAVAEFLDPDPIIAYNLFVGTASSAALDGTLQDELRIQSAKLGDASLSSVVTPFAPTFSAYSSAKTKTKNPTRYPSSQPSSRPSHRPDQTVSLTTNNFSIWVASALWGAVCIIAGLLLFYACKRQVGNVVYKCKCCFRRVEPEPEPEPGNKQRFNSRSSSADPASHLSLLLNLFSVSRVAPEPPPLLLPQFSIEQERKESEDIELEVAHRLVYDSTPRPRMAPLDLGLASPVTLRGAAGALAIQAKVVRTLQRKQQLALHRNSPPQALPVFTSVAAAATLSP